MAESIKLPNMPTGRPEQQIVQMYSYMYRMAQTMNVNLKEIGNGALTDEEAALMNRITAELQEPGIQAQPAYNYAEAETLKSLIIKTAQFVKNEVDNYRLVLFGDESAEGSQGNWKRKKGLRVDVTPDGVQQTYSYAEIVQGLKTFEINAKNYIKTGYLRTENAVPIYGVAIGRDVVTFSEDGTETYNDSNKVAELTADALTFYQGGNPVAKYTGSKLSFYINGSEIFYIQSGKIYCAQDLELASGKKLIINTTNFKVDSSGNVTITGKIAAGSGSTFAGTMSADCITSGSIDASVIDVKNINASKITSGTMSASKINGGTLTLGGNNNANGVMNIKNSSGTVIGTFDKDGINYSGNFKITSSGSIDVDTTNFAINSNNNVVRTGSWRIGGDGVSYNNSSVGSGEVNYLGISCGAGQAHFSFGFKGDSELYGLGFDESKIWPQAPTGTISLGYYVDQYVQSKFNYIYANYFNGQLVNNSSREIKHNIQPLPDRGAEIDALEPVTFVYNDDAEERQRAGLIYEDTIGIMPEICTGDENNKAINYVELIPYLLKEIQDLRKRVKALEDKEDR